MLQWVMLVLVYALGSVGSVFLLRRSLAIRQHQLAVPRRAFEPPWQVQVGLAIGLWVFLTIAVVSGAYVVNQAESHSR